MSDAEHQDAASLPCHASCRMSYTTCALWMVSLTSTIEHHSTVPLYLKYPMDHFTCPIRADVHTACRMHTVHGSSSTVPSPSITQCVCGSHTFSHASVVRMATRFRNLADPYSILHTPYSVLRAPCWGILLPPLHLVSPPLRRPVYHLLVVSIHGVPRSTSTSTTHDSNSAR